MIRRYTVMETDGRLSQGSVDFGDVPGVADIRAVVLPFLAGGRMERVRVLVGDDYTDMFVDDDGMAKGLPANAEATRIYRHNWLVHHPEASAAGLPEIYGTAVLFDKPVWF